MPLKTILAQKAYNRIRWAIKIISRRYFVANRRIHNLRNSRFLRKAAKYATFYRLQFKAAFYRLQVFDCQYLIIDKYDKIRHNQYYAKIHK